MDTLTQQAFNIHPFVDAEAKVVTAAGFERDGGRWTLRAERASFVVHVATVARRLESPFELYTLDAYENARVRRPGSVATYSARTLDETLNMVDLLSKFWGV